LITDPSAAAPSFLPVVHASKSEASPSRDSAGCYLNWFPEVRAMAKKSKDARSYVKIISSESDHCYYVQKNRNNTKGRLELRKFDPTIRKHVAYKESK
jgi:large subunit ribosomal protein L33